MSGTGAKSRSNQHHNPVSLWAVPEHSAQPRVLKLVTPTNNEPAAAATMARCHLVWYHRVGLSQLQQQSSSFTSSAATAATAAAARQSPPAATTTTTASTTSRRQAFKRLQVHPSILVQIENLGIGIPPRKQRTRSYLPSSSRATTELYQRPVPPLPFGTKPRLVRHVGKAEELITTTTSTTTTATAAAAADNGTMTAANSNNNNSNDNPINNKKKPPPLLTLPEVAIAGRSNVGKSTLLNALLFYDAHRLKKGKHKAVVSKRPGETIEIAIYELEKRLRIVDLPGYGFAYGKKQYQELVVNYLSYRGSTILKRILLLIDARHGMKTTDYDFLNLLEQQSTPNKTIPPIQLVLTKCDTVKQIDLARRVAQVQYQLSDALRREPNKSFPVLLVSVNPPRQVAGVYELQKTIAMLAKKKKSIPTKRTTSATEEEDDDDNDDKISTATTTTGTATSSSPPAKIKKPSARQLERQAIRDYQNRFHRKYRSQSTSSTSVGTPLAAATTTSTTTGATSLPRTSSPASTRVDYSSAGTRSSSISGSSRSSRPPGTLQRDGTTRAFRQQRHDEGVVSRPSPRTKAPLLPPPPPIRAPHKSSTRSNNNNKYHDSAPPTERYSVRRPSRTFRGGQERSSFSPRTTGTTTNTTQASHAPSSSAATTTTRRKNSYSAVKKPNRTFRGGTGPESSLSSSSNVQQRKKTRTSSATRKPQKFAARSNKSTGRSYRKSTRTGPTRKQSQQGPRRKARQ